MMQQQLERIEQKIPASLMQFCRAVELRERRDSETLAGLVRALSNPRGADAERFVELLRGIVRQELASKRN
jgi:hypothetical protein